MKRNTLFIIATLSLILSSLIVGCASIARASDPSNDESRFAGIDLYGTSWTLYQIGQDVVSGSAATLIFADGQVHGNATCNGFFGPYERDGAQLSFGLMATTMMACENLGQETDYLAALAAVTTFRLQDGRLILADAQNDLLVFEPARHATLEGTTWQLTGLNTGTTMSSALLDTQMTATFSDGQVTGSAGCNRYFGSATANDRQLTIGMLGSTEMFCGQPEGVMEQELAYLQALQSATTFEIEGNVLTILNGDGEHMLEFATIEN
ncbi:MAG: META domain-containing protein [Anaerolineae bacterium]|nr:META domain-containing protein [Anaerolineae bacterium]